MNRFKAKNPSATESDILKKTFKSFINGLTKRVYDFVNKSSANKKDVNCD